MVYHNILFSDDEDSGKCGKCNKCGRSCGYDPIENLTCFEFVVNIIVCIVFIPLLAFTGVMIMEFIKYLSMLVIEKCYD